MRPAHCAREVDGGVLHPRAGGPASMRPAHCAREVDNQARVSVQLSPGFNEARALCAGSLQGAGVRPS